MNSYISSNKIKFILFLFIFFTYSPFITSKESKDKEPLAYEEIIQKIEQKDINFIDKYELSYRHLSPKEQIDIDKRLVEYAKKEKEKKYLIMLYCNLFSNSNIVNPDIDSNKLYLDSASTYIDQTSSNDEIGMLYYKLGSYYSKRPNLYNSDKLQLEYLYNSIPYFEKSDKLHYMLAEVYSMISYAYITKNDYVSSKTTLDKMRTLKFERTDTEKASLFRIYSSMADYYSGMKTNLLKPAVPMDTSSYYMYIDSTVYFINKSIQVYKSLKDSTPTDIIPQSLMATNYFNLALEKSLKYSIHPDKNWEELFNYLEEGKLYLDSTNHTGWLNYYFTKGRIYQGQNKLEEADAEYLNAKSVLDKNPNMYNIEFHYLRLYKQFVVVNARLKNYEYALYYQILYSNTQEKVYATDRYKAVKELEVKYETAEKELEISRLNEDKQRTQSRIIIGIAIILIILVILIISLLYSRIQRLKKEKEADELTNRVTQKEMEFQILAKETEQRLTRRYLDGREEEKKRLAKELHDTIANEVVSVIMLLESGKNLDKAIDSLKKEHNKIRNISHQLMPSEFEYISFLDMVLDYVDILNQTTKIHFECFYDEEQISLFDSMPKKLSVELYNIVQEAINNIIKHSQADTAELNMKFTDNHFILSIKDNGKGFDTSLTYRGIGLHTIKDRCNDVKAELTINSSVGNGCTIIICSAYQEPHLQG